jgi:hypothetical protein
MVDARQRIRSILDEMSLRTYVVRYLTADVFELYFPNINRFNKSDYKRGDIKTNNSNLILLKFISDLILCAFKQHIFVIFTSVVNSYSILSDYKLYLSNAIPFFYCYMTHKANYQIDCPDDDVMHFKIVTILTIRAKTRNFGPLTRHGIKKNPELWSPLTHIAFEEGINICTRMKKQYENMSHSIKTPLECLVSNKPCVLGTTNYYTGISF